ncbi:hypothetical protein ACXR0O_00885 [Verrucomicrobiota bacterium sgz303538]
MAAIIGGTITFVGMHERGKTSSLSETADTPRLEESRRPFTLSPENTESLRLPESFAPLDIPVPIDMRKAFAREKRLPVLDSETLGLDSSVIELLELTPMQVEHINESLRRFLQRLQSEELTHAFVSVDPNGNEEIVVSAFDRSPLVKQLQTEISEKSIPDIADFLTGQLPYDSTLAVTDAEIRVAIETGDDGADRVSFTRRLRRSDAVDDKTPIVVDGRGTIFGDVKVQFSPTDIVTTKRLLGGGISPRLTHLFTAASSLPRRTTIP